MIFTIQIHLNITQSSLVVVYSVLGRISYMKNKLQNALQEVADSRCTEDNIKKNCRRHILRTEQRVLLNYTEDQINSTSLPIK